MKYVALFRDTHSYFTWSSSFAANAGMLVDLYGGKVLVETVDRLILPLSRFPSFPGDEITAIDRPVESLLDEFEPYVNEGNDRRRRRVAAGESTFRTQDYIPRAAELGETSVFQIRHQTGATGSYTVTWTKTGVPATRLGPVATPKALPANPRAAAADESSLELLESYGNASARPQPVDQYKQSLIESKEGDVDGAVRESAFGAQFSPYLQTSLCGVGYSSRTPSSPQHITSVDAAWGICGYRVLPRPTRLPL